MKLYEVPFGTKIRLRDAEGNLLIFTFEKLDGMFAVCRDEQGNVDTFAAWANVEIEK